MPQNDRVTASQRGQTVIATSNTPTLPDDARELYSCTSPTRETSCARGKMLVEWSEPLVCWQSAPDVEKGIGRGVWVVDGG